MHKKRHLGRERDIKEKIRERQLKKRETGRQRRQKVSISTYKGEIIGIKKGENSRESPKTGEEKRESV